MRALIVLLGLVAAPYVAGVSQGRPESGHRELKSTRAARPSSVRSSDARPVGVRTEAGGCEQQGQNDGADAGCGVALPPPPPPPPPASAPEIHGSVWLDANMDGLRDPTEVGVPDWQIMLNGAVAGITDANGNFSLTAPSGTYQVCEVQRFNWYQTFPTTGTGCAGAGYSVVLGVGQVVTGNDFGNFN